MSTPTPGRAEEGTSLKSAHSPKFTPIRELGKGAYGVVQLVRGQDGKEYAQKIVNMDQAVIFNEMDLCTRLVHPNLIRCVHVEAYIDDDNQHLLALTMERADNDMTDWLKQKRRVQPAQIVDIMHQLLSAVLFLHKQGYYHCDIKPANILMFGDKPKLADMGIAYPFEYKQPYCGTPGWGPPQGLYQKDFPESNFTQEELDYKQADIYSLGLVMLYLLTGGRTMYDIGEGNMLDNYKTFDQRIARWIARAKEAGDQDTKECFEVIKEMCASSQSNRYTTIEDVLVQPLFARKYDIPIPGYLNTPKLPNQCFNINPQVFKDGINEIMSSFNSHMNNFPGNGLSLMIAITLYERCFPLFAEYTEDLQYIFLTSILYIATAYLQQERYQPSEEEWQAIVSIINFVQGVIRVPSIYDVATSAEEIKEFVKIIPIECSVLHLNPVQQRRIVAKPKESIITFDL